MLENWHYFTVLYYVIIYVYSIKYSTLRIIILTFCKLLLWGAIRSKLKVFFYNEKSLNLISQYDWEFFPRILNLQILTHGFLPPDSYPWVPTSVFLPPDSYSRILTPGFLPQYFYPQDSYLILPGFPTLGFLPPESYTRALTPYIKFTAPKMDEIPAKCKEKTVCRIYPNL